MGLCKQQYFECRGFLLWKDILLPDPFGELEELAFSVM